MRMQTVARAFAPFFAVMMLAVISLAGAASAQEKSERKSERRSEQKENGLPTAWHGVWHGVMHNTGKSGKTAKVPVVFEILAVKGSADLIWRKTYGEGKGQVVKDYRLTRDSKHTGRFVVDERNGIKLALRNVGHVLHGCFRIKEQVYTARYELRKDTLSFEITVAEPSGDQQEHGVQDYATTVVQAANLTRKKGG